MSKQDKIEARRRASNPYPQLSSILNPKVLRRHVDAGIVKATPHDRGGLVVFNYTGLCERRRCWDGVTCVTRGLVRDSKGLVIARPFQKFFGWGQKTTSALRAVRWTDEWYALEKLDGTMVTASNHHGELLLATRGSFDAWQLERVAAIWPDGLLPAPGVTWVLEYVGPDNQIVVRYDEEQLYALGVISNWDGSDDFSALAELWQCGFSAPAHYEADGPDALLKLCANDGSAEGFVVIWPRKGRPSGRLKVKHPAYIEAHRTRCGGKELGAVEVQPPVE
jgi:RNA ligase